MSDPVGTFTDRPSPRRLVERTRRFDGRVLGLRTDVVDLGDGQRVTRDVVEHPGAVGIIALDAHDRVLLVQQYRHPIGALLWEPPAGLLDVPDEDFAVAAARELYEEAGYRAATWHVLVDVYNTPGGSDEAIRIYLARDLSAVPEVERYVGEHEERDMPIDWLPLEDAVSAVLAGRLSNPTAVCGVLATAVSRQRSWSDLRPAGAPWRRRDSRGA